MKSSRALVAAVVGLVVLGCLGSALASAFLVGAVADFGGSGQWEKNGIPESRWLPAFGVRMPNKPLLAIGRELGFQDVYVEVLVQLPPGSAQAFLDLNHLARGEAGAYDTSLHLEIDRLAPGTPALTPHRLELPVAVTKDGGPSGLYREGTLYEGPGGETWLHLVAFDT